MPAAVREQARPSTLPCVGGGGVDAAGLVAVDPERLRAQRHAGEVVAHAPAGRAPAIGQPQAGGGVPALVDLAVAVVVQAVAHARGRRAASPTPVTSQTGEAVRSAAQRMTPRRLHSPTPLSVQALPSVGVRSSSAAAVAVVVQAVAQGLLPGHLVGAEQLDGGGVVAHPVGRLPGRRAGAHREGGLGDSGATRPGPCRTRPRWTQKLVGGDQQIGVGGVDPAVAVVVQAVAHLGSVGGAGVFAAVGRLAVEIDEARLAGLDRAGAGHAGVDRPGQVAQPAAGAAPAGVVLQVEVLVGPAVAVVVHAVADVALGQHRPHAAQAARQADVSAPACRGRCRRRCRRRSRPPPSGKQALPTRGSLSSMSPSQSLSTRSQISWPPLLGTQAYSQPLRGTRSRSTNPGWQVVILHVPWSQVAPALAKLQALPQAPQWATSVLRSKPWSAVPSQSLSWPSQISWPLLVSAALAAVLGQAVQVDVAGGAGVEAAAAGLAQRGGVGEAAGDAAATAVGGVGLQLEALVDHAVAVVVLSRCRSPATESTSGPRLAGHAVGALDQVGIGDGVGHQHHVRRGGVAGADGEAARLAAERQQHRHDGQPGPRAAREPDVPNRPYHRRPRRRGSATAARAATAARSDPARPRPGPARRPPRRRSRRRADTSRVTAHSDVPVRPHPAGLSRRGRWSPGRGRPRTSPWPGTQT